MTDPKLTEIVNSVRHAGFKIGAELNDDKCLLFVVIVQGVGEFSFELKPAEAMEIAERLAIPVALAVARGDLP